MRNVVLGITGSIAAYKAVELTRCLKEKGHAVQIVMTQSAQAFITPLTLQAISGLEVRDELFDTQVEAAMGHIELARWADLMLIAPATADCLAKLAHGLADDLLTTLYLATEAPVTVAPAMNQMMWLHPATQANVTKLKEHAVQIVGPGEGKQACGEIGFGRMLEPLTIINTLGL